MVNKQGGQFRNYRYTVLSRLNTLVTISSVDSQGLGKRGKWGVGSNSFTRKLLLARYCPRHALLGLTLPAVFLIDN